MTVLPVHSVKLNTLALMPGILWALLGKVPLKPCERKTVHESSPSIYTEALASKQKDLFLLGFPSPSLAIILVELRYLTIWWISCIPTVPFCFLLWDCLTTMGVSSYQNPSSGKKCRTSTHRYPLPLSVQKHTLQNIISVLFMFWSAGLL